MINLQVPVRTLTLEQYAALVLMRQAPGMVGLLDDPQFVGDTSILAGLCCPEDETPHYYQIDVNTATLISIEAVQQSATA